jgi:Flp pilus assembly pilin Flp
VTGRIVVVIAVVVVVVGGGVGNVVDFPTRFHRR